MPCHPLFLNDDAGKYDVPANEGEILPNKPGYTTVQEISEAEFIGFLRAQEYFIDKLGQKTRFNLKYLYALHKKALHDVYSFAGKLRTVNMSKGGFSFPSALFLPQAMYSFEQEILLPLNHTYKDKSDLVRDLAKMHAELLFIHPFREGNGRTTRLLTAMIYLYHTRSYPDIDKLLNERKEEYIAAVQAAALQDYQKMYRLFREGF